MATRNQVMVSVKGSSNNKEYMTIHNTVKKKNTSSGCQFPEFSVNSNKIGEENSSLKFEFYEIKKQNQKIIGELDTTLIGLFNNNGKKFSVYRNNLVVGKLRVVLTKDDHNNFLNYISDGFCLKLIIGMDFCEDSRFITFEKDESNLRKNLALCSEAVMRMAKLLKHFDEDDRTVCLGFGARLPPAHTVVSHCFAMNNNYFDPLIPNLSDFDRVMRETHERVKRHGPKVISETINFAIEVASAFKEKGEHK